MIMIMYYILELIISLIILNLKANCLERNNITGNHNDNLTISHSEAHCFHHCIHGFCSQSSDGICICDLGWTGHDCNTNCGCNNHSSCEKGISICTNCKDYTEGINCEKCVKGAYGNATTSFGCHECQCHGHGDPEKGFCNPNTGQCYCTDNTSGFNCESCKSGYYGDPVKGGHCYLDCHSRGVITQAKLGYFGSGFMTSNSLIQCLWIITVHNDFNSSNFYSSSNFIENSQRPNPILLTIERNMKIDCPFNHIQIYDGVPDYVSLTGSKIKLGNYCGVNLQHDIKMVAYSGFLTVFYERYDSSHGFNASYQVLECPGSCTTKKNHVCVNGYCECEKGYYGYDCDKIACPNNCSAEQNQGTCDQMNGRCVCMPNFGGEDCSEIISGNKLVWTTLFNAEATASYLPSLASYLPRMGHSLEIIQDSLWLFGGYSTLRGQLSDIFRFNIISSRWEEIKPKKRRDLLPEPRHFHATTSYGELIYLYGGLSSNEKVLGDFWCFNTSDQTWTKLPHIHEVMLAGHTLTAAGNGIIYLIGGYSSNYGFLDNMFQYDISANKWQPTKIKGFFPPGIYGHTSVFHKANDISESGIYVFGGLIYEVDSTMISSNLYGYSFARDSWSRLTPDPPELKPIPRYFHSAVTTDSYMLVIGGRSNETNNNLIRDILVYVYKCNRWESLEIDSIGEPPIASLGLATVLHENHLFVFGGFNGFAHGKLSRLTFPKDLCQLFSHSRIGCLKFLDCTFCALYENGINRTFCYSKDVGEQICQNTKGASEFTRSRECDAKWHERRACGQYESCVDCVAIWPYYSKSKDTCKWCSGCPHEICIPKNSSYRDYQVEDVSTSHKCLSQLPCLASDCSKCILLNDCIWTRHVIRSKKLTVTSKPISDWTCVRNLQNKFTEMAPFIVESMPPLICPKRCHVQTNCTNCLESTGSEGGWHECVWSETNNECLSPSFINLKCEGGFCGNLVFQDSKNQCPPQCWQLTQSAHCLSHVSCGWCGFSGKRVDGKGVCMTGGIFGPTGGVCKADNVQVFGKTLSPEISQWMAQSDGPPTWFYLEKPLENECLNGHHTCDERYEECVDLADGFMCICKQGYVIDRNQCKPTCKQGCIFGICIAPNICQCNFGYVGKNCSLACECNGHSNCAGINKLSNCLECQNNTQGLQCEKCKPFYVGNPVNSGKCISCRAYCNGHSDLCFSPETINNSYLFLNEHEDFIDFIKEGPVSDAICLNCEHNTQGERCDQCKPGYFKSTKNIRDGCRSCQCHGHGDMCNPLNGEDCNCQNNTQNEASCMFEVVKTTQRPDEIHPMNNCWQMQCSRCKKDFIGNPKNGHQCYRHMYMDENYCFDPFTQSNCNHPFKINPLHWSRTVFFAVQPRYMNVDIRIVVDVTRGGLDFFISSKDNHFIVDMNKTNGIHQILFDKHYANEVKRKYKIDLQELLLKKESISNDSLYSMLSSSIFVQTQQHLPSVILDQRYHKSTELTCHLTVSQPIEFLIIKNLQNRLVITIPQEVHDLRSTKFYMILRGVGNGTVNQTYGNLFFRQDQSRIDLFVFFSVFFSCFFLFLAGCVVIWKIKQGFDMRRARRLHAAEMKHMASRPFSIVFAHIDPSSDPDDFEFALSSPAHHLHSNVKRAKNYRSKASYSSIKESPKISKDQEIAERYLIRPVAVEPTSDGLSAVVTTLIALPGGSTAPIRMSLGSALVPIKGSHNILNYNHHNSTNNVTSIGTGVWKVAMRRRGF